MLPMFRFLFFFFFKQKTAYEMCGRDWSSDVCSSDLTVEPDLIATEMLEFPSKSSRNKNDSDPINGNTDPI